MHLAVHILQSMDGTGGAVYEPFCGTGTTLIAAERLGRRCLAVELVPQYVDVAVRRWQDHVGKAAILDRTGDSPIPVGGNP
jgi:DNA modification methylase